MIKVNLIDIKKMLRSGWQSWSYDSNSLFKFPIMNYNPKEKSTFVPKFIDQKRKKPAYGWCSWYSYGWDINERKILDQAIWISKNKDSKKLPLNYILIDGGWNLVGDWQSEDRTKFPNGLKKIVTDIKNLNLKSGIWIAPFLVHKRSQIAVCHPDWLVKKNKKNIDGLKLTPFDKYLPHGKWILNIKNPKVIKYLDDSIKYLVETCGFELIKFDFLYGIYFDPNLSATEADAFLNSFLSRIRKKYPNVYTIACGCPLVPAVGAVDSMRIGPDTSINPFIKFLSLPFFSQNYLNRQVIQTVSKRLWTKKFWNVDPDAFMCRRTLGFLPKQLLEFQKIIKQGNGNIFLGDDLTRLSHKRLNKYVYPLFVK